jgi:hypothetical protein
LVWLGKFFVDFVWSNWQQMLAGGLKKAIGSWDVVDALNLVCHQHTSKIDNVTSCSLCNITPDSSILL